jgi:hypothetical protein
MLAKLLGIGDLLATVVVILAHYHVIGWKIIFIFSLFLIIKGWLFRESIMSLVDILCGLYIFVMMFGFTTIISWVVAIYLFQKACFSLAAN